LVFVVVVMVVVVVVAGEEGGGVEWGARIEEAFCLPCPGVDGVDAAVDGADDDGERAAGAFVGVCVGVCVCVWREGTEGWWGLLAEGGEVL
jgi:hypothetical protein